MVRNEQPKEAFSYRRLTQPSNFNTSPLDNRQKRRWFRNRPGVISEQTDQIPRLCGISIRLSHNFGQLMHLIGM